VKNNYKDPVAVQGIFASSILFLKRKAATIDKMLKVAASM
jgi:hypothetical protein